MPRIQRKLEPRAVSRHPGLLAELAEELRNAHEGGQPRIEEQVSPATGRLRVQVFWDKWEPLSDEQWVAVIRQAYEQVEGKEFQDRIALAMGLTIPEAIEYGMVPYRVVTAVRQDDPVTLEQCHEAMIAEGASVLLDPKKPLLCFATEEEAEACRQRLIQRLPKSEAVWLISTEMAQIAWANGAGYQRRWGRIEGQTILLAGGNRERLARVVRRPEPLAALRRGDCSAPRLH